MGKRVLVFIALILSFSAGSQVTYSIPDDLSEESKIYLITCGPGTAIWSHFGHTAIEVVDPSNGIDLAFNYGMFQFDDNFVYKFAKRELLYYLHVSRTKDFVESYKIEDRSVYRQELLITSEQRDALYQYLRLDYIDPERRFYLYEFFFDNCATRPRDAIESAVLNKNPKNWFKSIRITMLLLSEKLSTNNLNQPHGLTLALIWCWVLQLIVKPAVVSLCFTRCT